MRVLRAFRNMLVAAVRHPLSTFLTILWSPLTAGGYIAKLVFILAVIFLMTSEMINFFVTIYHVRRNFPALSIIDIFMAVVTVALGWRWLTAPLLRHFGDKASDTHGSARFATKQETARLAQSAGGLLVGVHRVGVTRRAR